MKGLSQLTEKIREWNFMGLNMLPTLQIAIIHSSKFNSQIIEVLKAFECQDLLYNESIENIDGKNQGLVEKKPQNQNSFDNSQIKNLVNNQYQKMIKQQKNVEKSQQKKQITVEKFDSRLRNSLYVIYLAHKPIDCRIHLVIDKQNDGKINDQTLKKTKKIIEKFKRNKSIIFVNFNAETHKLDEMSQHIEQFGLSFKTKQRQIRGDHLLYYGHEKKKKISKENFLSKKNKFVSKQDKNNITKLQEFKNVSSVQFKSMVQFNNSIKRKIDCKFDMIAINFSQLLMSRIQKKYISIFGVEINKNFIEMKIFHKQILAQIKRYNELFQIHQAMKRFQNKKVRLENVNNRSDHFKDHMLTKYALRSLYRSKQYLISSLQGTFSNIEMIQVASKSKRFSPSNRQRSLHWQIMQIINEIWDIEGDSLLKQIDKMSLTYIKERYKMLDYQTLGGFIPATCFEAIFSSPLKKMVEHIMETLQIIQMKIVAQIRCVVEYFFHHTSCCYDFSDSLGEQISQISKQFRKQTYKVLKSQVQFISVSSEDFWSFKQVKSNLYAPQQQVYIQIKYIGKNYIKKVFDSIKETLPRLIGQNLLKQINNFLETDSLTLLTDILNQNPLAIQLNSYELQKIQKIKFQQKQINDLVYYFSLKTSSEVNVKNLNERLEKSWKRMFGKNLFKQFQGEQQSKDVRRQGFLAWARQLFMKQKKTQRSKRSMSQQKREHFHKQHVEIQNPQYIQTKKTLALSEKNWLLIVNTEKFVQLQKIYLSGCQGFPSRLRPSIWLYLARKQSKTNIIPKVQSLLDEALKVQQQESIQITEVFKQIEKDVNRTPPPNLFKKGFLKDSLTRVLRAYSIFDKSLRYTQGMNFIVAIILCVLTHYGQDQGFQHQNSRGSKKYIQVLQNNCFFIFVHMMQKKGLRKIMLIERQIITDLCIKLTSYIEKNSPLMSEKIQHSGFTIEMIFSPALISALTSADVEFLLQKRVIDFIVVSDFSHLYKVIGGFVVAAQDLCTKFQGQMLYYFLKGKIYNQVYKVIGDDGLAKMFKGL